MVKLSSGMESPPSLGIQLAQLHFPAKFRMSGLNYDVTRAIATEQIFNPGVYFAFALFLCCN